MNPAGDEWTVNHEWNEYWQGIADDMILVAALIVFDNQLLFKSSYSDEMISKMRKRIKVLIRQYDSAIRREYDYDNQ